MTIPVVEKCPECPYLADPAQPCLCHRPRMWEPPAAADGREAVARRRAGKPRLALGQRPPDKQGGD